MGLVLLALFDRDVVGREVLVGREALDRLPGEVAVRHRMAHHHDPLAEVAKDGGHAAAGLALPRARPGGADRHHRHATAEGRMAGSEQEIVGARGERAGGEVHDVLVGDVAVAEDHDVHRELVNQPLEVRLGEDRDPPRIPRAREHRRIHPIRDVRDLGGRERDHLVGGVVAEERVEIVKVPTCCPEDQRPLRHVPSPA